jgi:hypothetical protein
LTIENLGIEDVEDRTMTTATFTTVIDVIEAFADGEAVDPSALDAALADPAGRAHLLDVLALRALVGGDAAARPAVLQASVIATSSRGAWARWIPLASGIAIIGGITGYLAGARTTAAAATETAVSSPAPPPTQVIQLRNGVDWTEHAGG